MAIDPRHPRPQLQRSGWKSLDGVWGFALDRDGRWTRPEQVVFDDSIVVPFAPETPASGVVVKGFVDRVWYRRKVDVPKLRKGERLLVHFGAVDRVATIYVNGRLAAKHTGGYTPFVVDLTDFVPGHKTVEITVRADDDASDLGVPRGKQDWQRTPHAIWYPRTTGIWQSVWLERVPPISVRTLHWTGNPDDLSVEFEAVVDGAAADGARVLIEIKHGNRILVDDSVALPDPGTPTRTIRRRLYLEHTVDNTDALVWRPSKPTLLDARVQVVHGSTIDAVESYFAIRSVDVADGKLLLNGFPRRLRMALDQGYWPDSGMTAPDTDALKRDVELALELGLNGVRKHQKVEDPRWLYWCDRLGLLVWEELPSAYVFSPATVAALSQEWTEVIERDRDHPCIVAWVPMNESWGVPALARSKAQRATVASLAALTRALDPTRPVSANDGWETDGGDIIGVHDYAQDGEILRQRYGSADAVDHTVRNVQPALRRITLDGSGPEGRPVVVSECGGVTLAASTDGLFSYGNTTTPEAFVARISELCSALNSSDGVVGWCWTQLTDTYQEANGLATMERKPKAPVDELKKALKSS